MGGILQKVQGRMAAKRGQMGSPMGGGAGAMAVPEMPQDAAPAYPSPDQSAAAGPAAEDASKAMPSMMGAGVPGMVGNGALAGMGGGAAMQGFADEMMQRQQPSAPSGMSGLIARLLAARGGPVPGGSAY